MANKDALSEDEVRGLLAEKIKAIGSASLWAEKYELSPAYISDVLAKRRSPGKSILAALGLRKIVQYERGRV